MRCRRIAIIGLGASLGLLLALGVLTNGWPFAFSDCVQGPGSPNVCGNGDVNADGGIDISDPVYLLNFLFVGGPAPRAFAAQTKYLSIPACALLPSNNDIAYDTNGVRMATFEGATTTFKAPVFLPHGAHVTKMTLEGLDAHGTLEFGAAVVAQLEQYRYNTYFPLGNVESTGPEAPGNFRKSVALNATIDNSEFSYALAVFLFTAGNVNNAMFYKVIIEYE
jgi:hypothetical protein